MTLDFVRLAEQLDGLVTHLEQDAREREIRIATAVRMLQQTSEDQAKAAIHGAKHANWLLAWPEEPLDTRHSVPRLTGGYAALATDGSSIDVDRHSPASCYVINIGHAWLDYRASAAELSSDSALAYASQDLLLGDEENASKESVMTGNLLDAYRTALEMRRLADLAGLHQRDRPLVGMLDGQFVLWGIKEAELSSAARDVIFTNGVLAALDRLRAASESGGLAIGSYISRPGSREVTNMLRIVDCPREPCADCLDCPRRKGFPRPCDRVAGGTDAQLFAGYLREGERSAVFKRFSASADFRNTDTQYEVAGHGMRFFYLHVSGGEVARVEMPAWVAEDTAAISLLHAAILDQCELGGGYPVVLQEAHEQAVIDGPARRSFAALVGRELELRGIVTQTSGKAFSKSRRAI